MATRKTATKSSAESKAGRVERAAKALLASAGDNLQHLDDRRVVEMDAQAAAALIKALGTKPETLAGQEAPKPAPSATLSEDEAREQHRLAVHSG